MKKSQRLSEVAARRDSAMPEVKKIVKKHGRTVVVWCINQLREYEKKVRQLEQLKKEAAKLEKEIS